MRFSALAFNDVLYNATLFFDSGLVKRCTSSLCLTYLNLRTPFFLAPSSPLLPFSSSSSSSPPSPTPLHTYYHNIAIIALITIVGPHAILRNICLIKLSLSRISFSFLASTPINASRAPGCHSELFFWPSVAR